VPTYGLEFSDLYTRIKDYANINNVVNADTKAKRAANDALRLISTLRNWEILKRESTITPTASTQAYTLASNFDHIISCWYVSNGVRIPIDVIDDERWNNESDNDSDGNPLICRITKVDGTLKIQFSPRPSGTFISQYTNIPYDYVIKPTELSGDTDVPNIPDTSQQMAIVYLAVSDLLGKQGDINGMTAWEMKATRLLNTAHRIDDKKQGRTPRLGRPMIPINSSKGSRMDYNE
jgi:hypothetical protein